MGSLGIRTAVLCCYEVGELGYKMQGGPLQELRNALTMIGYTAACVTRGPRGRTKPVNVQEMVDLWVPVVVQLATAHDKDTFDEAEAQLDKLLTPILSAPVRQVREFYTALLERMKADTRVPMLVWMGFEAWGAVMVKDAPDEGVKRLKNKLAQEIADLVEEDIRPQIPEAIARALRWRSPETLEAVKEQVLAGEKPKLKGRESCLFLEVGRGKKKATVML